MNSFTELTKESVPALWERRHELFAQDSVSLLNVSVDSAGVAFLVRWSKSLGEGKKLVLKDASADVERLINVFKISQLFSME